MSDSNLWPPIRDEAFVETLIPAIQTTIASMSSKAGDPAVVRGVPGPDVANVLLLLLASVLEPAPACATPQGMRKLAEAAGKELHARMKDGRRFKESEATASTLRH